MRGCSRPQRHGHKWRVVHPDEQGRRARTTFDSEREALKFIDDFYAATASAFGHSVAQAVDDYLASRRSAGLKAGTVTTLGYRLKGLLRSAERDRPLTTMTAAVAKRLLAERKTKRGKRPSTDTLLGELVAAQGWSAWCVKQGWLRVDPFVGLEVTGARNRGKAQLRIDEARRYVEVALLEGTPAGLAAAMALLMGMRASEITGRQVRDVDDRGRVLWIERAKTKRGDRHLEVPEVLRAPLLALCESRKSTEPLFGPVDRHWVGYHVRRLCGVAKVPEVCPHGLRGTQASISVLAVPAEHVAAALGQTGPAVTRRHYLSGGAEERGRGRAALKVIEGGKR
jgi:integrase